MDKEEKKSEGMVGKDMQNLSKRNCWAYERSNEIYGQEREKRRDCERID